MRSVRDIRATIKTLQESALARHGIVLRNHAIREYLEHMAQEKASDMIEDAFSQFSLTDLISTLKVLEEDDPPPAQEKVKPKPRKDLN